MAILILTLLFIILNIVDVLLTRSVIKMGGKEINPLARRFGIYHVKVGGTLFLIIVGVLSSFLIVFTIADAVLLFVCIWNFIQWVGQRRIRKWVRDGRV